MEKLYMKESRPSKKR